MTCFVIVALAMILSTVMVASDNAEQDQWRVYTRKTLLKMIANLPPCSPLESWVPLSNLCSCSSLIFCGKVLMAKETITLTAAASKGEQVGEMRLWLRKKQNCCSSSFCDTCYCTVLWQKHQ